MKSTQPERDIVLKEKVDSLPNLPGVYLFKGENSEVIYCGKALSIKKRVQSYFRAAVDPNPRRQSISLYVKDIECIVTRSELEALILESTLIKKHKPRFNVLLRDDKQYPHICITMNEAYPRLKVVRRPKKDGNMYFGPYIPAKAMRRTLNLINQFFQVRRCRTPFPKSTKRPCLNHQMGLCRAPCAGMISQEEYRGLIQEVSLFLKGKRDDLVKMLKMKMDQAASDERYEKAAALRDQIEAIESCMERQFVFSQGFEDQDCFAFAKEGNTASVQVFFIRYGKMTGKKALSIQGVEAVPDSELMADILEQFYNNGKMVPPTILVQVMPADKELIGRWLSEKRGTSVEIVEPKRGKNRELMLMAKQNAFLGLRPSKGEGTREMEGLMMQMKTDLRLPRLPRRIEGFDISNLGPTEAVGSMVYWQDTMPVKSRYRRFKIKGVEGIDDYGMMAEVIKRRYTRSLKEGEDMPDLVLIDGGRGHLQAGLKALSDIGLPEIPVASLAKKEEIIFLPGEDSPLRLPERSPTLQLLQRVRDEAHRFALAYQKARRGKRAFSSVLDAIPGVGPRRKAILLRHFGGLDAIGQASLVELCSVSGIDKGTADRIFQHFHN